MKEVAEIDRLLEAHGAVLVRHRKHYVYALPNGKKFVRSSTPSDRNAPKADLRDLRKVLGLVNHETIIGDRREKKVRNGRERHETYTKSINPFADKLRLSGVLESTLRDRLEAADQQNALLLEMLDSHGCFWCQFQEWAGDLWHKIKQVPANITR